MVQRLSKSEPTVEFHTNLQLNNSPRDKEDPNSYLTVGMRCEFRGWKNDNENIEGRGYGFMLPCLLKNQKKKILLFFSKISFLKTVDTS